MLDQKSTLSEKEFCTAVGISRLTAYRLRRDGKLPHCRVGSRVLYLPKHIEEFLTHHERPILSLSQGIRTDSDYHSANTKTAKKGK